MDRLDQLAADLNLLLAELRQEAAQCDRRELLAPLAWLDEAGGWLNYELVRAKRPHERLDVPFSYVPIELRH